MHVYNLAHWTRMSESERRRVEAAPAEYRALLVELWGAVRDEREPIEAREDAEKLEGLTQIFRRGLDDDWPDGKRRVQLQKVMQGRAKKLAEKYGGASLDAIRERDAEGYRRFLDGCARALLRDTLIAAGLLSKPELQAMRARQLGREHDERWGNVADDFEDWRAGK